MVMQLFVLTSFKIPSDSMEPSLLAGDYILVDKCSKGARLFDVSAALEKKEVKIHRMPGWRKFKRNDVLVFNFPYPGSWDSIAFDVMSYYVKRCIAVPGDTLEINDCHYRVKGYNGCLGNTAAQDKLQKLLDSEEFVNRGIVVESYPFNKELGWSIAEFGPLYIPAKGSVVGMDSLNRMLYRNLIEWEQKEKLTFKRDTVLLGDSVISRYCFRENYYFVSGDRMENSKDSRYWGLLPEPFIVGRALRIWKSKDDMSGSIKWERVWKKIE
ncbi:signal peptidase I [Bacteroides uniformis]|uniref:Signal peptidase I n=2 Tax=Bacteroides uniformis TaxID=820 RepID=A0A412X4Q2_BACUN|nr:signal peptidase I [Bacteroides uniformis]